MLLVLVMSLSLATLCACGNSDDSSESETDSESGTESGSSTESGTESGTTDDSTGSGDDTTEPVVTTYTVTFGDESTTVDEGATIVAPYS